MGFFGGKSMTLAEIVTRYISEYGLAIVPIPRGSKGPTGQGWQKPGGYFTDPDQATEYFTKNPNQNIGAVLGPSNIVSIDVDDVDATNLIFSEFGIDIFALRDACPSMCGNPERFRIWFRAPEGIELSRHSIAWPLKEIDPENPDKKTFTVFELRGGAVQDVIAPSIHPDTKKPYKWITKLSAGLTELPDDILNFWLNWDIFKANAMSICPWSEDAPKPKPTASAPHEGSDLIGRYNSENDIHSTLTQYGYKRIGKRYLSPNSGTKIPGVVVFDDNRCWIHHASDSLCSDETGRPVSPFDLYCHNDHGGDAKKAVKQLAKDWGLKPEPRKAEARKSEARMAEPQRTESQTLLPRDTINYFDPLIDITVKGKPLASIENLREILNRIGVIVRYDIIRKREDYLIPGQGFTTDNRDNASLSWIISECAKFNYPTPKVPEFLTYLADKNQYNPVVTWIESKPWDGVERLPELYDTIWCKRNADNDLKEMLIRKWMISAIAAAFSPDGVSASGVLVLQGEQSLGKTKWFLNLVPQNLDLTKDGLMLDPKSKDSVKQACSFWLVELGELDATFKRAEISQLKAFITNKLDVIRLPYARKDSHFARRTVFFGSVNPKEFLHDPTGNRRFWTIECEKINYTHNLNMQQIWAEVLHLYREGESHYLERDEIENLNAHNETFTASNPIHERLATMMDWDKPVEFWDWSTASMLLVSLGIDRPTPSEVASAGLYLAKRHMGQKAVNGTKYIKVPSVKPKGSLPNEPPNS